MAYSWNRESQWHTKILNLIVCFLYFRNKFVVFLKILRSTSVHSWNFCNGEWDQNFEFLQSNFLRFALVMNCFWVKNGVKIWLNIGFHFKLMNIKNFCEFLCETVYFQTLNFSVDVRRNEGSGKLLKFQKLFACSLILMPIYTFLDN